MTSIATKAPRDQLQCENGSFITPIYDLDHIGARAPPLYVVESTTQRGTPVRVVVSSKLILGKWQAQPHKIHKAALGCLIQ
jgi:hypothetical protein